jgi:hypothetical protein
MFKSYKHTVIHKYFDRLSHTYISKKTTVKLLGTV